MFASANAFSPDGIPLPTATLALTLDDETQYRCAGYIQAEIERYAELLDDEDNRSDRSDVEGSDNGEENEKQTKKKKKVAKEGTESLRLAIPFANH